MSLLIRFSPQLGPWVSEHLDAGRAPAELVRLMVQQQMAPEAAQAIVGAFVHARASGGPLPYDSVEMPDPDAANDAIAGYRYETARLRPGNSISTSDRVVRVAARAAQPVLAVLNNVLSTDECTRLIELARPRLAPSTIVDPITGRDVIAGHRSSFGMFFRPQENAFMSVLRQALATDSLASAGVYFGTTSGELYGSADEGESWSRIAEHLPAILSVETLVVDR